MKYFLPFGKLNSHKWFGSAPKSLDVARQGQDQES